MEDSPECGAVDNDKKKAARKKDADREKDDDRKKDDDRDDQDKERWKLAVLKTLYERGQLDAFCR